MTTLLNIGIGMYFGIGIVYTSHYHNKYDNKIITFLCPIFWPLISFCEIYIDKE